MPQVDITQRYLDNSRQHNVDRLATTDLFTRLGHLRDLPNISFPELDDNFFNRVQPESFIKRKEREARKKQEEEEEKYNPSSEDFQPSYRTETPRPHTDSY